LDRRIFDVVGSHARDEQIAKYRPKVSEFPLCTKDYVQSLFQGSVARKGNPE
jgi:hypothetical protein